MFHLLKFHLIFQNPPVLPVPSSAIQCGANPSDFKSSARHRQRGGAGIAENWLSDWHGGRQRWGSACDLHYTWNSELIVVKCLKCSPWGKLVTTILSRVSVQYAKFTMSWGGQRELEDTVGLFTRQFSFKEAAPTKDQKKVGNYGAQPLSLHPRLQLLWRVELKKRLGIRTHCGSAALLTLVGENPSARACV